MRNKPRCTALVSVTASFTAFCAAGRLVSAVTDGTSGGATVSYVAAWLSAFLVLKAGTSFLDDPSAEEETIGLDSDDADGVTASQQTKKMSLSCDAVACVLSLAVLLLANFAMGALLGGEPAAAVTLRAVVIGTTVKPICEESLFRFAYISVLIRHGRLSRASAIFVTSVLFALVHSRETMLFAAGAGLILGILATRHYEIGRAGAIRGAACSLAVHSAYNLTLYAVAAFMPHAA